MKKTTLKEEVIKFIKALMHGIIIPTLIAGLVLYVQTDKNILEAELLGAVYLLIPVFIYSETKIPEPAGFYVLALSYFYGILITWALIEEGAQHVC